MTKGDIIRIEMLLMIWPLFPAVMSLIADGARTALAVYICCVAVPQPFLLIPYFMEKRRRRRRRRF